MATKPRNLLNSVPVAKPSPRAIPVARAATPVVKNAVPGVITKQKKKG